MRKCTLDLSIVDSENTVIRVMKDGKVLRNLTMKNSDIQPLIDEIQKINK